MSVSIRMPWDREELLLWEIVGMNHYRTPAGARHLFVAMTREGLCIRAEGGIEALVFEQLARQANEMEEEITRCKLQ